MRHATATIEIERGDDVLEYEVTVQVVVEPADRSTGWGGSAWVQEIDRCVPAFHGTLPELWTAVQQHEDLFISRALED